MARWLLLPLALAVAVVAGCLLLATPGDAPTFRLPSVASPPPARAPARAAKPSASKPGKPMGQIDEASRRELERVLEDEGLGR